MSIGKATSISCANIAFIKYWGNRDHPLRIPAAGSISMNLDGLVSRTTVTFDSALANDVVVLSNAVQSHEASVSKVGEEQLFYLMTRGLTEEAATSMVVSGFIEPLVKELPMEYAVEMNRLIQLQMEGSVG